MKYNNTALLATLYVIRRSVLNTLSAKKMILFVLLSELAFTSVSYKKKEPEKYLYVSSADGLVVYDKPEMTGIKLGLVPLGEKVGVIEEQADTVLIDDTYGKWMNISCKTTTGWSFSGNMCSFDILTVKDFAAKSISEEYKKFIKERNDELNGFDGEKTKLINKFISRLTNLSAANFRVITVKGNYVLIEYNGSWFNSFNDWIKDWEHIQETWEIRVLYVWTGKWEQVINYVRWGTLYLLYLDNDQYPDLITKDNEEGISIYLGLPDEAVINKSGLERFKRVEQDEPLPGEVGISGRCDKTVITWSDGTMFAFDCQQNKMVKIKSGK